jgi:hypothetical protein
MHLYLVSWSMVANRLGCILFLFFKKKPGLGLIRVGKIFNPCNLLLIIQNISFKLVSLIFFFFFENNQFDLF